MATRIQVLESLAASAGMNPMTLERMLRVLGLAGLIPTGGPGRRTADFESEPLTNVLLGMGAPQPSEAAEAVRILGNLRCDTNPLSNLGLGGGEPLFRIELEVTFSDWLKNMVERMASPDEAKMLISQASQNGFYDSVVIGMNLDLQSVHVMVPKMDTQNYHYESFGGERLRTTTAMARHRRVEVKIDLHLLAAAGTLLADTRAKQSNKLISDPFPAGDEKETTAETAKAAEPASSNGPQSSQSADRAYPALTQTACSTKAQSNEEKGSKQLASESLRCEPQVRRTAIGRSPLTSLKRTRHHENWSAASPA